MNRIGKYYGDMTLEELQQELREAFLDTDIIDEPLNEELEELREELNSRRPVEYLYTPEESWTRFWEKNREELEAILSRETNLRSRVAGAKRLRVSYGSGMRSPRHRTVLRGVLIAAVIVVLLAGAALAADYAGLWAWTPRWNAAAGWYEPVAQEVSGENPIPAALRELGITEPVYPSKLPEGFTLTESRISEDPLVLMEQYARNDQRLSITVTPIEGFKTAVYQAEGSAAAQYPSGGGVHYMFKNAGTITVVWYTQNYATSVSGDITREEIKGIMDSVAERSAG